MSSKKSHLEDINPDTIDWKSKDEKYWKEVLSPEQYAVCRLAGTERAFTGKYYDSKEPGEYVCASCGLKLFSSKDKFNSGTGWPSFTAPVDPKAVELSTDTSHGMTRTEVHCPRCGAHLGHVFDDGPGPTHKRFCINSVCLLHKSNEK